MPDELHVQLEEVDSYKLVIRVTGEPPTLKIVAPTPTTAAVYCIECGNPTNSNGSGYCPSCYVRFTPEGFFGLGDQ